MHMLVVSYIFLFFFALFSFLVYFEYNIIINIIYMCCMKCCVLGVAERLYIQQSGCSAGPRSE